MAEGADMARPVLEPVRRSGLLAGQPLRHALPTLLHLAGAESCAPTKPTYAVNPFPEYNRNGFLNSHYVRPSTDNNENRTQIFRIFTDFCRAICVDLCSIFTAAIRSIRSENPMTTSPMSTMQHE
jgi:hypothetical protein